MDPTFYRRIRVSRAHATTVFDHLSPHELRYLSHTNEWDIVSQLAAPEGVTLPDWYGGCCGSDDMEYGEHSSHQVGLEVRDETWLTARMLSVVADDTVHEAAPQATFPIISFQQYLHCRHGIELRTGDWHPDLHSQAAKKHGAFQSVANILLYKGA